MVLAQPGDHDSRPNQQITEMALTDWRLATESGIRAVDNWEHDELASQMAAMMRESVTPETYVRFENARGTWDVREHLGNIVTPTLIMHPRNHQYFPVAVAQRAASAIPGARLTLLDTASVLFPDAKIAFVAGEFVGTAVARRTAPRHQRSGTAVILFADIADSTALTERLGDAAFRETARALDASLRAAVRDHGGAVIDAKTLGDGILATFPAASQAIAAALACAGVGDDAALPLHVGLHAGDVIREQDNVFGGAVNIAARISSLAQPGEVLVSDVVRALARTSAGVRFEDRGEHALKGVADAQRVFSVQTERVDG
jgi:class 3 adenylate cyclase